jgi:hypothetical protein
MGLIKIIMATHAEASELDSHVTTVERVNTTHSFVIPDEDRNKVMRSDYGKKLTHSTEDTTTTKRKRNKPTKKDNLLTNKDIKRWYDNLARSSLVTAEVRLRKLSKFCENNKITPMELVELGLKTPRAVADLLEDTITTMEKNGSAPQYIKAIITSVKSWLEHYDIEVKRHLKITNSDATPTLANERVPDAAEMTELFDRADLRSGVIMSLIAKAGLRPEVIGNFDASDGLVIKDLPELEIANGTARFAKIPAKIVVRNTLSKAGHRYFTFITESGAKKILAYLNQRIGDGEVLDPESPLIVPLVRYHKFRGKNENKKFLSTARIEEDVREAMRPRFKWRPYVLRSFFDTQLLIAESRGKIAHDFRVFFMGHVGSIEAKYTTNKSILTAELENEMYEAFKRSQEFLDLERNGQQVQEIGSRQKVVTQTEVEQFLANDWKYLGTLQNGSVVIER